MNVLGGILCFLQIADFAFKVKDRLFPKPDKEKMGVFLHLVGELLLEVANYLEAGRYPHDKCQEMWHYLDQLKKTVAGVLSTGEALFLEEQIQKSYRVEELFGQVSTLDAKDKMEQLQTLRSAAGSFIAASNLLKIK